MRYKKSAYKTRMFLFCCFLVSFLFASVSGPVSAADDQADDTGNVPASEEEPGFFFFTDNSLSLLPYGIGYRVDPYKQTTLTFEHADASRIGDFFMFVDYNIFYGDDGTDTAWYGEFGPRLSFGKVFKKDLSYTLFKRSLFEIKDVLLATQYERGDDPDVAEAALVGIGFDLDLREAGFLGRLGKFNYMQLNFYGRAELTEGTEKGINDMQISMVASYPFTVGSHQFLIDGYFDWVLGLGDEVWSYHWNPQITVDLGASHGKPGKYYAGFELDMWWNKYQIPDSPEFDTDQTAISFLFKIHL